MFWLAGIFVTVVMLVYVMKPLFAAESVGDGGTDEITPLIDLARRRAVVYDNIKDLEFEYAAGKLGVDDYQRLRQAHLNEAAQLLARAREMEIEVEYEATFKERARELSARPAGASKPASAKACPECGFSNAPYAKACAQCGTRMR